MEIRELKTFVTAAEYMNFSKAAEKLGYTQASVTLQIQHLEKELSVCLFDRIGKKVYLTDKGTLLLEHAQILIRNIESLTAKLQNNTASMETIRIGISESLLSCDFSDLIHVFPLFCQNPEAAGLWHIFSGLLYKVLPFPATGIRRNRGKMILH